MMMLKRGDTMTRWATSASAPSLPYSTTTTADAEESAEPPLTENYFETSLCALVCKRFPWLLGLMMVQSISGVIVDRYAELVSQHIVLASFLTMLVGGGGNSSGQTIASLIQRLGSGEVKDGQMCRVLMRELAIALQPMQSVLLLYSPVQRLKTRPARQVTGVYS